MPTFITRFLDYWHPGLALFVESDLWPNIMLGASARQIPMILVNGRMLNGNLTKTRRPGMLVGELGGGWPPANSCRLGGSRQAAA